MQKVNTYLLHIETATKICSVALSENGAYLHHITESSTLQHAKIITLQIESVLKEAGVSMDQLAGIVLSEGPGSYTSLRVGMSVAKGISYGKDIPLIAVNTLEALAIEAKQRRPETDYICAMIDARRMEVYASLYGPDMNKLVDNEPIILGSELFDSYQTTNEKIVLCGNGIQKAQTVFRDKPMEFIVPESDARYLIRPGFDKYQAGDFVDIAYFSPNYIKSPNITKAKNKLL